MLNPAPKRSRIMPALNSQRVIGVLMIVVFTGLILILLGIIPADFPEPSVPVWIVVAVFGMFWFVGLLLLTQHTRFERYVGLLAAASILLGFGLTLNWGAFGPGERECTRTISLPFLSAGAEASDTECRVVIGYFAGILDAVLFIAIASRAAVTFGDHFWTRVLLYLGYGLLLLLLLPLALVIAAVMFATGSRNKLKAWFGKLFHHRD
jgi:hypothetical protein